MTRFPVVMRFRGCPRRGVPERSAKPARKENSSAERNARLGTTRVFKRTGRKTVLAVALIAAWVPQTLWAQLAGGGPFSTGAANFQANLLTILAPIAVIGVMVIGAAAWFNKISWGWAAAAAGGLILVFGAPQIVAWVRGMAGV